MKSFNLPKKTNSMGFFTHLICVNFSESGFLSSLLKIFFTEILSMKSIPLNLVKTILHGILYSCYFPYKQQNHSQVCKQHIMRQMMASSFARSVLGVRVIVVQLLVGEQQVLIETFWNCCFRCSLIPHQFPTSDDFTSLMW